MIERLMINYKTKTPGMGTTRISKFQDYMPR